jgi:hypothetical protein
MIRRTSAFLACLLFCGNAAAQPEDRRAAAQALFEQGKALVEAGKFKEACPKLADSQRLDPGIGTSLWLADCYENNGQTASAWAQFKEAAAAAAMQKDPREKLARMRAQDLEKRLTRLTITHTGSAKGITIKRDGVDVGSSELGNALPVDPGSHEIVASAPGAKPWRKTVDVPPQSVTVSVAVPDLERDEGASASPAPIAGGAPAPGAKEEGDSDGSTQRIIGLVVAGAGIAGVGVGTFFAFSAKSTYDDSNENGRCIENVCGPEGLRMRDDAESKALVATIAMGVGAVAVVAGAVLFFTAPRSRAVAVAPSGLVVRF